MIESLSGRDIQVPAKDPLTRELLRSPWIEDFASQIYVHSEWTFSHSERVAKIAESLGQNLGFPTEDRLNLAIAGLLHDVGKIQVPNAILNKPEGILTDEERAILDKHPKIGFDLVRKQNESASLLIVSHHEFQERSYPRVAERPVDEKTRTLQSFIALADEVDAMLSERPYKPGWDADKARAALSQSFSPNLVNLAISIRQTLPAPTLPA